MKFRRLYIILLISAAFLATSAVTSSADVKVDYMYNLSSFEGVKSFSGATMFVDKGQDELYTVSADGVGIFNNYGMEVYSFGDDGSLGNIGGGAVNDKDGTILFVTSHYNYNPTAKTSTYVTGLTLCNYRGEPISKVTLKDVPAGFDDFTPGDLVSLGDKIYLADASAMKVLVIDWTGKCLDSYNIGNIMGMSEKKIRDTGMTGFNVDKDGNIFYTISVNFQAYKLTPERKLTSFGSPGGSPGKFNVATGIATDDAGNIYVVDSLKSAVEVFNKDFGFLTAFGGRGWGPGDLIAPHQITISKDMVYVNQSADRGVNVYRIKIN